GLRRGDLDPRQHQGEVRVPGEMGHRPPVRARALPHREARQEAGDRDELSESDQGVLHAAERRRQDGGGDGRTRAGHRRDRRRQPARGAPRSARRAHGRGRDRQGKPRLVSRPPALRHRAARRLRPRLRAHRGLRDRAIQRARRHPLPPHARQRALLMRIRLARPGDTQAIVDFNAAMALETEGKRLFPEVIGAGVRSLLRRPKAGFYLLAEKQAEIAGVLMITTEWSDWRNGAFWWIQSVYVRPEFRRQGVYRRLYQHVKRLAKNDRRVCGFRLYVE